jgi:hypothetical protein
MTRSSLWLVMTLFASGSAFAQCDSAPGEFTQTCGQLQHYVDKLESTVTSHWDGKRTPVSFSTELLSANDNRGPQVLLNPTTLEGARREMDAIASKLGVQAITILVGFPTLYQPFYQYNKDPEDYGKVLSFYKSVMSEARKRGLKVAIESSVVFPMEARDLPLNSYYATLSESGLIAGRTQVALAIAQELQPDWLNMGSEPDTQSALLGHRQIFSPQEYAKIISGIVTELRKAGVAGKPLIGAGIGTWDPNATGFVKALAGTGVDYIDLHVFTINGDFINNTLACLDAAHAAGKGVAISETWLKKVSDSDLQGGGKFHTVRILRQAALTSFYSFWGPLDARFIDAMVKLAYWKNLYYLSPVASNLLFAYTDYEQSRNLDLRGRRRQNNEAEVAALRSGSLSVAGKAYAAAIGGGPR